MNVGHVLCPERQIEQQNSLKLKVILQTSAFVLYPRKHEEEH